MGSGENQGFPQARGWLRKADLALETPLNTEAGTARGQAGVQVLGPVSLTLSPEPGLPRHSLALLLTSKGCRQGDRSLGRLVPKEKGEGRLGLGRSPAVRPGRLAWTEMSSLGQCPPILEPITGEDHVGLTSPLQGLLAQSGYRRDK